MEENTDIEYHRDVIQQDISRINQVHDIFQTISNHILGGYSYIISDIGFKLDNSKKDPQYLNTQYNMFKIYLNAYIQLINQMIPELQKSKLMALTLFHNLSTQIEQIGTPSFGLIDETNLMGIDVSNLDNDTDLSSDIGLSSNFDITQALLGNKVSITQQQSQHQNIIKLHDEIDENFEKIVDPTQEETDEKNNIFTDHKEDMGDIVIERKEKKPDEIPDETKTELSDVLPDDKNDNSNEETTDKPTDSSIDTKDKPKDPSIDYSVIFSIENPIDTNQQRNIFLEEHPDEHINKYHKLHDGPQLTDLVINNDIIIWNGEREKYFITFMLSQFKLNPMFSAHDIYHLLCANLLPNYVSIAHIYDKYTQNYEIHLTNIKDQILIKIGFKTIMLSYISNEELFNEQKAYEIITEWNDAFHELSFAK